MQQSESVLNPLARIRLWYALLLVVCSLFVVRLFYLQVIRHDHYQKAALSSQLKEYEIPPERGVIEAHSGSETVPIVLNQKLYTLYADPVYVKDARQAGDGLARAVGGNAAEYEKLLKLEDTRYVVLAKKLSKEQSEAVNKLELKGVGTREVPYRTYPQGALAAQMLGFVNDEGEGKYGIEQALDQTLRGTPGQLKAITDASGVPLAANEDNVNIEPKAGERVVLTMDVRMQQQLEDALKHGLKRAQSESGSAVIMDAQTGAIRAMANYPSFNPADFAKVTDGSVFSNAAVAEPLEIGSIMKPLTAAAALDLGVIHKDQTYYDPAQYTIDNATVRNIEEDGGAGTRSIRDILQLSLNTGATWLLMQMGGGQINQQARERWYDYMTKHYQLGKPTGVEQGYEAPGVIPDPNDGFGLNIRYANASFGQGMTATPLQMAGALASVVNGGTYYQPHLVEKTINSEGKEHSDYPKKVRENVVSREVGRTISDMMQYTLEKNRHIYGITQDFSKYRVGGKTGTAEVARPEGGYYENIFNGMFMGFVGGDQAEYVIVVRVNKPKIPGYAGSTAAAPLFIDLATMLIHNFGVSPRSS